MSPRADADFSSLPQHNAQHHYSGPTWPASRTGPRSPLLFRPASTRARRDVMLVKGGTSLAWARRRGWVPVWG
ncbi:hypothetical protein COCCADRAFT_101570 [Bipolaris zeicola 26-R-13]|uniref:Uncharacterized protein n=1 Tax=Cochliobolus carbonum (strain 26-R-13) TaxID=930089 RepID=W6Y158_COCC2|nr:uncharacterized protein COCCADRAFT_101570 [Bipolaris zeicola 26-R-13]EUC31320.1 hypothetical protein COCCADRAFT_101570 [Bipolaris zeicola 26-R-13]